MLTINEEIRLALGLQIIDYRSSQLANGMRLELPVAGYHQCFGIARRQ
ncbi:MAG: hypothetical protein H7246_19155 [Phycisphaerae bacterium]|nr:hypothetical protein [Saprospiraceae bacterium]